MQFRPLLTKCSLAILVAIATTLANVDVVRADVLSVVNVNFNNSAYQNANNTGINTYMQGVLTSGGYAGTVTVYGAREGHDSSGNGYDGEGYSVGPLNTTTHRVTGMYLGNTEGGQLNGSNTFDGYIYNDGGTTIRMVFTAPIYGIAFDFEIFPNGDVPDGNTVNPNNYPDFTFQAFAGSQKVVDYHVVSIMPGKTGSYSDGLIYSPNSYNNGTNSHAETAPQFLGSASFSFPNGVTELRFIDWPVRIGIDNLAITTTHAPEPASFCIFAISFGAVGAAYWHRKRKAA